jgi:serine/threonine protein kinase
MTPSSQIAHYRLSVKLGEGGMGAVYRATDTKLNRDVAIKVLPPSFAEDSARMQRFEREAQVLASLNHPNVAAIYGIEAGAIVMELVEGEDLKGPVPIDTAIDYARQIAAGLEAAHERGIVHRDLKPANIKVTTDGVVKLLDFGLAKAGEASVSTAGAASPAMSPTLSLAMTQAGMILGTAAYMAPEQARGKPVDKRADIWAFGVVLYELLTGAMLFGGGETVSDSLAAVLTREPDYGTLPKDTPPRLRRLIERCLRKDPKQRLRDIGEARILLDEPETAAALSASTSAPPRRWLGVAAGVAMLLAAALGFGWWSAAHRAPEPKPMIRLNVDLGPTAQQGNLASAWLSPNGTHLAFLSPQANIVEFQGYAVYAPREPLPKRLRACQTAGGLCYRDTFGMGWFEKDRGSQNGSTAET